MSSQANVKNSSLRAESDKKLREYKAIVESPYTSEPVSYTLASALCSQGQVTEALKSLGILNDPDYREENDIGLAKIFSAIFGNVARYNITSRTYFIFDGKRWLKDDGDMIVERLAKMLAQSLYTVSLQADDKHFLKFVAKLGDRRKRITMIQDARSFNPVSESDFDTQPNLFNCLNGVLDLDNYTLLPHAPEMLLSKIAGVRYDPKADVADWLKFMGEIMLNDYEKIKYIQRWHGYSLLGSSPEEQAVIYFGPDTRNGKSTMLSTLSAMFGDYARNADPETLAKKNKDTSHASSDIARLKGCRFVTMAEPPKNMILNSKLLKEFTGNDTITARNLFENDFEFTPVFKLFIHTNYLPVINDDAVFRSGRLNVVTFERHFSEAEQDKTLKSRLKSSARLSGLLNWCLEGLRLYREEGLNPPESVRKATADYRESCDKVAMFVKECLLEDPETNTSGKSAYEAYAAWCRSNGYGVEGKKNFMASLRVKGLLVDTGTIGRVTAHNVIVGRRLTSDFSSDWTPSGKTVFDIDD